MTEDADPPLALLLLRASRWFDRRTISELEARGWPRLTPAQTLTFAHLDSHGTPPALLARRLGTTRQSTADLIAVLNRLGLIEVHDDPARVRGRLVCLSPRGQELAADARAILATDERALPAEDVTQLRGALTRLALGEPTS